jgi:hypothetical protein
MPAGAVPAPHVSFAEAECDALRRIRAECASIMVDLNCGDASSVPTTEPSRKRPRCPRGHVPAPAVLVDTTLADVAPVLRMRLAPRIDELFDRARTVRDGGVRRFAFVARRSGSQYHKGRCDRWVVHKAFDGAATPTRLATVSDTTFGAFLAVVAVKDPALRTPDGIARWVASVARSDEAATAWLAALGDATVDAPLAIGSGGRPSSTSSVSAAQGGDDGAVASSSSTSAFCSSPSPSPPSSSGSTKDPSVGSSPKPSPR